MSSPLISIVVIGRNEGDRLARCLQSVRDIVPPGGEVELIHVDSQSTDGSPNIALNFNAKVLVVTPDHPTAAWGRNAGWRAASAPFVLFLDGDTILDRHFLLDTIHEFNDHKVAVVWGHRREINTEASIYNRVLDLEWIYPDDHEAFCGGDAIMRRSVLEEMGGFDETLIAGEEPDLCTRMRSAGYEIKHVDRPMTGHDLAITSFSQYWRRAFRTGHAYAEVSQRYKNTPVPIWQDEVRHNFIHGGALFSLVSVILVGLFFKSLILIASPIFIVTAFAYRTAWRFRWRTTDPKLGFIYGLHSHFQKIPIFLGQIQYFLNRRKGRRHHLIEYKEA